MKSRRVFVTLELDTDMNLSLLKKPAFWKGLWEFSNRPGGVLVVEQANANVARTKKAKRR